MTSILSEARFYFAQCVFNTSCHYAAVERIDSKRSCRQKIAIAISAVSVILLACTTIAWECECATLLKILSLIGTLATAASLIFELFNREDLTEFMLYHKQAAEDYKALRERLMDLIRQIKENKKQEAIELELHKILNAYSLIGKYSLPTSQDDYKSAQIKLGLDGNGEGFTWSNDEIDSFLPKEIREAK